MENGLLLGFHGIDVASYLRNYVDVSTFDGVSMLLQAFWTVMVTSDAFGVTHTDLHTKNILLERAPFSGWFDFEFVVTDDCGKHCRANLRSRFRLTVVDWGNASFDVSINVLPNDLVKLLSPRTTKSSTRSNSEGGRISSCSSVSAKMISFTSYLAELNTFNDIKQLLKLSTAPGLAGWQTILREAAQQSCNKDLLVLDDCDQIKTICSVSENPYFELIGWSPFVPELLPYIGRGRPRLPAHAVKSPAERSRAYRARKKSSEAQEIQVAKEPVKQADLPLNIHKEPMRMLLTGEKVVVQPSPLGGLGVFAKAPISSGEIVTDYCGSVITLPGLEGYPETHMREWNRGMSCIDGLRYPLPGQGVASLINSSRGTELVRNVDWKKQYVAKLISKISVIATVDIATGTELLLDYDWERYVSQDEQKGVEPEIGAKKNQVVPKKKVVKRKRSEEMDEPNAKRKNTQFAEHEPIAKRRKVE